MWRANLKAHEAATVNYGDDLFNHVRDLNRRTLLILEQAEISGDLRIALAAIREARGNSELLCKMLVSAEASRKVESRSDTIASILQRRLDKFRTA